MTKKYIVIGNPIEHSLSPKLHNYWLKENNIDAFYDKKKLELLLLNLNFEITNIFYTPIESEYLNQNLNLYCLYMVSKKKE